jgi:hypothetical protein
MHKLQIQKADNKFNLISTKYGKCFYLSTLAMIFALILLQQAIPADAQEWQLLYDGRVVKDKARISTADEQVLRQIALPQAVKTWKESNNCDPEFKVLDIAQGSFTAKGTSQKVFLYRYCEIGHNMGTNGIAVLQNGKIVAHFGYQGGWDSAITKLPDLKNDGLNEIAIDIGSVNQGHCNGYIVILELKPQGVKKFGFIQTYYDNEGTDEKKQEQIAYKILTKPGKIPLFHKVQYGYTKSRWRQIGKPTIIKLQEDSTDYLIL